MYTNMDFSEKTKAIIDSIVQETVAPIMKKDEPENCEEKMHDAVKQWSENKQNNKFTGKEI